MQLSPEASAIVGATFLGPVFAVLVTRWRDAIRQVRERRLYVFRMLMATRRVPISNEHVMATNLVEVEFHRCRPVEAAYREYIRHLNDTSRPEDVAWHETKERLLAKLLSEMGRVIGINIDTLDIFKGGYAPKGWEHRFNRQNVALEYVNDLYEGKRVVPVVVLPPPGTQPSGSPPPRASPRLRGKSPP